MTKLYSVLHGHVSPETAYVVDDYPFGFTLRCQIRYWVETKKSHGQRLVSQTTNPKKLNDWPTANKPKPGTYADVVILYRVEHEGETQGHIQHWTLHGMGYMRNLNIMIAAGLYDQLDEGEKGRVMAWLKASEKYSLSSVNENMDLWSRVTAAWTGDEAETRSVVEQAGPVYTPKFREMYARVKYEQTGEPTKVEELL